MTSAEMIKRFFEKAVIGLDPASDEAVFDRIRAAYIKGSQNGSIEFRPVLWRYIMRRPLTRWGIAAAMAMAGLIGMSLWRGTGSGIVLADVLTRVEQVSVYMYQMSMTMTGQGVGDKTTNQDVQATIRVSRDQGMKISTVMRDRNSSQTVQQETYLLPQRKIMLTLMPGQKTYTRVDLDDTLLERVSKQNNDPRFMVEQILKCNYRNLGRSTLDGAEVEGFETTDPKCLSGMEGQVDVKLWVDVKTELPVRSEMDLQMGQMRVHAVVNGFQWNAFIDAKEFEGIIPDGYTTLAGGPMKIPAMNEETAIQGLRLFAEGSGRYPEKLDLMALTSQMGKLAMGKPRDANTPTAKRLEEETQGLTNEEKARKVVDTLMPIQGLGLFYMTLVQDKKDPAYYGHIVTPQDTDKVLMRWRVSQTEYRVIFGDLHAEMVTPERLADLETALPR
jgi:hypothetical protein